MPPGIGQQPPGVKIDLIENYSARKNQQGWEFIRRAIVVGVLGASYEKAVIAIEAVVALVGDINTPHPSEPDSVISDFRLVSETSEELTIDIEYRPKVFSLQFETPLIEGGASVSQIQTNLDWQGNEIVIPYIYPPTYEEDPTLRGVTASSQSVRLSKMVCDHRYIVTRREVAFPGTKSRNWSGLVNQGPWNVDPTAQPRTWFVIITYRSDSVPQQSWIVTYDCLYRRETWDQDAVFTDPRTGNPVPLVAEGYGRKRIQLYPMLNFNLLNLPVK